MNWLILAIGAALLASGCADETVVEPESDTLIIGDSPADSLEQIRVRADGMTVWASPRVLSANDWLFEARVSHSLSKISASVAGQAVDVALVSARKFEVSVPAQLMEQNLAEEPLLVAMETTTGREFTAMFVARARFVETTGSSKIYPWRNIEPIVVERKRVFRARMTAPENFVDLVGSNDDDSEPVVTRESEKYWLFDWYPGALVWAAHPTEDALMIRGEDADGNVYTRRAPIHMELMKIGVTNSDPAAAWPAPECAAEVAACVAQTDAQTADLEHCGTYREVWPCVVDLPVNDTPEWVKRYADDLRRAIINHYTVHGEDIVNSGGNTRPQALLSVDTRKIEEVSDPEYVPSGHDLETHRVFTHPDVMFPGSDIVWFGVYERASGSLVEVYEFN